MSKDQHTPFSSQKDLSTSFPLFLSEVPAGFASTADDHVDKKLDLNELLITHPAATFFVRVSGDSMKDAGIFSKDLLIVDKALTARSGNIVVALYQGEFTVKKLQKEKDSILLVPANPNYPTICVRQGDDFQIWGVVTHVIRSFV